MNSVTKVYKYYWEIFDSLPLYEQFHFASRLFLVRGDERAKFEIEKLKERYAKLSLEEVWNDLQSRLTNTAVINHAETRDKFLEKYPTIRSNARDLFCYYFSKKLFQIDLRSILNSKISADWDETKNLLLQDALAIKELSAYVINFVLLLEHYKRGDTDSSITSELYDVAGEIYDINSDPVQIEMWIYFLTHLIIGDTIFYTTKLSDAKKSLYKEMILKLEKVIEKNYFDIHLDCKIEFLVCAQLANYSSYLGKIILSECSVSISKEADFIVDTFSTNIQEHRKTAVTSEHRNVLFLIAYYNEIQKDELDH